MITGANTDVEYEGRTYHVQTEDRGRENPVVESLIYCQGEILGTRRYEYAEEMAESYNETRVIALVERQHQKLIREIRNGLWSEEGPHLVGEEFLTDRSFDELVSEFLQSDEELQRVHLELEGSPELIAGETLTLSLRARQGKKRGKLAADVHLVVRLVKQGEDPTLLAEGATDQKGRFTSEVTLNGESGAGTALVVAATVPGGGLLRIPLTRPS
jgi:hypothetical protein